jgi:hypothetical protein
MANKNDFDDEFEFKPLTDGLGFHKKVIDLKEASEGQPQRVPSKKPVSTSANAQMQNQNLWTPTLKTKEFAEAKKNKAVVVGGGTAIADSLNLEPVATGWPAAIFDSTMVLGLMLIFSAIIFDITRIDLAQLMEMLQNETSAQIGALVLLTSVYEIYTVTCRTFFGKTVGESVFQYQLGNAQAQNRAIYPLQVAWRSLTIALTGFIVLPLLSTIINQDLAGLLSGVSLYSEKQK